MGVTFIAPQGTYTAPAKLVSKSITENGTYDPADDNANGYSSVTVNVEGGGGSSDFSTAEVTVVNNCVEWSSTFEWASIYENGQMGIAISSTQEMRFGGTTNVLTVITYKEKGGIVISNAEAIGVDVEMAIQGDIVYENGAFTVSGNGTITFTDIVH